MLSNNSLSFPLAAAANATVFGTGLAFTNRTYISCDRMIAGHCTALVGHNRAYCSGTGTTMGKEVGGVTAICICDPFIGLEIDNCFEARCVYGADACRERNSIAYVVLGLGWIFVAVCAAVVVYGGYVMVHGRALGQLSGNATSSTLIWACLTAAMLFARTLADAVSATIPSNSPREFVSNPICTPILGLLFIVMLLNFPLMWVQIAQRAQRLEAAGTNLAKNARNAVVVASVLFAAAVIAIIVIFKGGPTLKAVFVLAQLIIMVVYIVASRKLLGAIGTTSETAKSIATLTKRLAIWLGVMVLVNLSYTPVDGSMYMARARGDKTDGIYMFLAIHSTALTPICFLVTILLFMRYIHQSFDRNARGPVRRVAPAPKAKQNSASARSTKESGSGSGGSVSADTDHKSTTSTDTETRSASGTGASTGGA